MIKARDETIVNRNLGFEKTEHLIFCPLCKQLVLAVKVEGAGAMKEVQIV